MPGGAPPPERTGPGGGTRRPESAPDLDLARERPPAPRPERPARTGAPRPRPDQRQEAHQAPQRDRPREPRSEQRQGPRREPERETERQQEQDRDPSGGSGVPLAGGGASSATTAMILHAITVLCCFNWLFGVAGIVFAVRAGHARDRNMPVKAETLTRYSWYCLGAAGVMVFVMFVLTFVVFTQAGSWLQEITGLVPY